ncbi:MAG: Flp pilus assembly complex ATPase component TadA [Phycisphaeraceae bacterium]|nr:Flp pilus assembly complex ATPase component TadA [Phycisphaeraceae bacterium]MCW5769215.1 Flp pilus assembly complex ATPase component TadA [Phycisphaeraceae bacterium]
MAKYNIDDILSELGVQKGEEGRRALPRDPRKQHRIDREEAAFSPLPAMPANQKVYQTAEEADETMSIDPAVRSRPESAPKTTVGPALSEVYTPSPGAIVPTGTSDLGQLLSAKGVITPEQLMTAQNVIRQSPGRSLIEVLLEQGVMEAPIQQAVAEMKGLPFERVDVEKGLDGGFDGKLLQRLTPEFCKQHMVLPLRMEGARAVVGAVNADDVFMIDDIKARLGVPGVKMVVITAYDIRGAMEIIGAGAAAEEQVDLDQIMTDVAESDVAIEKTTTSEVDLEQQAGEGPVIRYVNYIIQTALKEGASDIHIEPSEKKVKVRFRIDGVLFEMMNPPAAMGPAITSRLKIMAGLDIAERRVPQDGRIRCTVSGRKLDLRMSTLPNTYGEKTVMRILDTRSINVQLEDLGFESATLEIWRKLIDAPHGIILVTGPTGSGKTTTLYSSLRQLDKNKMNISTVEDPVEYHLDGITQTQTHEKIGMSFAKALKALLRQDPDVIMVGEIRDLETASTAIQASLTGHLVLSTLHTNDAPSSITRLVNIGVEPFLVGAATNGVLAQRLLRRLCTNCKAQEAPTEEMAEFLTMQGMESDTIWAAKGCDKCRNIGYSGRVGIYELLAVDDQLRDVIARNPNVSEFRRLCIERGMVALRDDGFRKVARGLTTVEEVLSATDGSH